MITRLNLYYYFLLYLFTLLVVQLNAQDVYYFDKNHGADYNLWNGKKYYIIYFNMVGHPFFNSDQFRNGSLLINGVFYKDVMINYDICNQQVIFQQNYSSGQIEQIILTKEFIDEFTIDGKLFRRMSFPETGTQFFQIISAGLMPCFLFWEKEVNFSVSSYATQFTSQSAKIYLLVSDQLYRVKNTSELIDVLGKQYRGDITRFKRRNNLSFRKVSDEKLGQLIDYCISLKNKNL